MSRMTIEGKVEGGPWYIMKWKGMVQLHFDGTPQLYNEEDAIGSTKANTDMEATLVLIVTATGEVSS